MTDEFAIPDEHQLHPDAKSELSTVLDGFLDRPTEKANDFDWDEFKRTDRFKAAMMPSRLFWVIQKFERSFTQRLGEELYEKAARAIADTNDDYGSAQTSYTLHDHTVYNAQVNRIESICRDLQNKDKRPDWVAERDAVIDHAGVGEPEEVGNLTWDVWVDEFAGQRPLAVEIKSPKPNLDQTVAAKRKMLLTVAACANTDDPLPIVRFAFPFNPYGDRSEYNNWAVKRVFDVADSPALWIAEEFWNELGGPHTMDALLNHIIQESQGSRARLRSIAGERTL